MIGNICCVIYILELFVLTVALKSMISINGLNDLIDNYDNFIIDQWGVIHDGKQLYSPVNECLLELRRKRKNLILLSNSSKRKLNALKGLRNVGVDPSIFQEVVTSGEIGWERLQSRQLGFSTSKLTNNLKIFLVGNGDDDEEYIQSCQCVISSLESADLVLVRGTFSIWHNQETNALYSSSTALMNDIDPILRKCDQLRLPMLITNPDFYRPGSNSPMPGLIGKRYSEISSNAVIEYIGKPYESVYSECLKALSSAPIGSNVTSSEGRSFMDMKRICCIGDSLEHDILGAMKAGIDSVWITNGLHCTDLGTEEGSLHLPAEEKIRAMLLRVGGNIHPTYILPVFKI